MSIATQAAEKIRTEGVAAFFDEWGESAMDVIYNHVEQGGDRNELPIAFADGSQLLLEVVIKIVA